MNRIKKIIEALRVISETPSTFIFQAFGRVIADAENDRSVSTKEDRQLITRIVQAAVSVAEDMEKPAKAPETN